MILKNMWHQLSFRMFLPKESFKIHSCKFNSTYQHVHKRIVNGTSFKECFKKDFCNITDQRKVASRILTFRPEILNSLRKFSEERVEIKSDANELLDEESWHRIGDSNEVEEFDEFEGISLHHGITGVFDIEEFVEILTKQNLDKIVVIAVPPQLNYVDYMVITTGRSPKQMTAAAEFIRSVFKRRCFESESSDSLPVIEGKNNKDWIALDLGNIALHIFSSKARKIYDLETLWTCGADFDDLSNEKENVLSDLMREHVFPSQKS